MCKYLIMKIFIVRGRLNHVRLWYGKINKAPEKRGEFWGPWAVVFYCMHIFCFFSLFTSKCCIEFDLCQNESWNFLFYNKQKLLTLFEHFTYILIQIFSFQNTEAHYNVLFLVFCSRMHNRHRVLKPVWHDEFLYRQLK